MKTHVMLVTMLALTLGAEGAALAQPETPDPEPIFAGPEAGGKALVLSSLPGHPARDLSALHTADEPGDPAPAGEPGPEGKGIWTFTGRGMYHHAIKNQDLPCPGFKVYLYEGNSFNRNTLVFRKTAFCDAEGNFREPGACSPA